MSSLTDEKFKVVDAGSYDVVASQFDRLSQRFTTPLAVRMIDLAGVSDGMRVLDVATGSGVAALCAAERVGVSGMVTGVDLSHGMLAVARINAGDRGLQHTTFEVMDAERLESPDAAFDVVMSLFALHHFPNPAAALSEMLRVMKPGGRLCVGVGSPPPRLSADGAGDAFTQVRDLVSRTRGRLLRAPQYINGLVRRELPDATEDELTPLASNDWKKTDTVPDLVRGAGFVNVHTDWVGRREVIGTAEEFWELQRIYSSTARKRLPTLTAAASKEFRRKFFDGCARVLNKGGELVYSYAALFVVGTRPRVGGA